VRTWRGISHTIRTGPHAKKGGDFGAFQRVGSHPCEKFKAVARHFPRSKNGIKPASTGLAHADDPVGFNIKNKKKETK